MNKEDALLVLANRTVGYFVLVVKIAIVAGLIFGVMYFIGYLQHRYKELIK